MYNTLGFTDKAARDEEWARIKATGARGVVRYTTHDQNHPQIIYVLGYPVVSNQPQSESTSAEVPLTDEQVREKIAQEATSDENSVPTPQSSAETCPDDSETDIPSAS